MAVDDGNVIQLFGKKKQAKKPDDISRTWVESFLIFMRDKYGLTFSRYLKESGYSIGELTEIWYNELQGTPKAAFQRMVEMVRYDHNYKTFMPHLNEVIWMCRPSPEEMGYPSEEEAYRMFAHQQYRQSPPVYHAVMRIADRHNTRLLPEAQAKRIFLPLYREVIAAIKRGEKIYCDVPNFPALPPEAPKPIGEYIDIQKPKGHISKMYQMLGINKNIH